MSGVTGYPELPVPSTLLPFNTMDPAYAQYTSTPTPVVSRATSPIPGFIPQTVPPPVECQLTYVTDFTCMLVLMNQNQGQFQEHVS